MPMTSTNNAPINTMNHSKLMIWLVRTHIHCVATNRAVPRLTFNQYKMIQFIGLISILNRSQSFVLPTYAWSGKPVINCSTSSAFGMLLIIIDNYRWSLSEIDRYPYGDIHIWIIAMTSFAFVTDSNTNFRAKRSIRRRERCNIGDVIMFSGRYDAWPRAGEKQPEKSSFISKLYSFHYFHFNQGKYCCENS